MSQERYEIKGKIGQGGVGAVYQAFDTQLNREVAIKRVLAEGGYEDQEEATKHLLKEATALSSVQHPHIVTVYDAGIDTDGPYVVMELIEGKTLDEMVERATPAIFLAGFCITGIPHQRFIKANDDAFFALVVFKQLLREELLYRHKPHRIAVKRDVREPVAWHHHTEHTQRFEIQHFGLKATGIGVLH